MQAPNDLYMMTTSSAVVQTLPSLPANAQLVRLEYGPICLQSQFFFRLELQKKIFVYFFNMLDLHVKHEIVQGIVNRIQVQKTKKFFCNYALIFHTKAINTMQKGVIFSGNIVTNIFTPNFQT